MQFDSMRMDLPITFSQNKSKYVVKKKYTKISHAIFIFILLGVTLLSQGSCYAVEWLDYQGISGFYGKSDLTNIGPDPEKNYDWSNISYFVGKNFRPWLSLETHLGPGYIKIDKLDSSRSLEWRLLLDVHSKYLYLKIGTGVAYLFDSENVPDLSDAHFFSIVSCSTGIRYQFNKGLSNGPELRVGYTVEHLSDPFKGAEDGDTGLNVGAFTANISWNF